MCTCNQCFEQQKKRKISHFLHLKIVIFTAIKIGSILHRRVKVMLGSDSAGFTVCHSLYNLGATCVT